VVLKSEQKIVYEGRGIFYLLRMGYKVGSMGNLTLGFSRNFKIGGNCKVSIK
jgi:hypothetical protein